MELYERILSKQEINSRFVTACHAILKCGLISTKSGLAESLGAKPAKFSEILNYRMSAGIDMIARMCDYYYVSPEWLLMGRGKRVFCKTTERPDYWIEDDNNLDRSEAQYPEDLAEVTKTDKTLDPMSELLYSKTLEQAELIGQLKARIKDLEQRLEKTAGDANTGNTANVG